MPPGGWLSPPFGGGFCGAIVTLGGSTGADSGYSVVSGKSIELRAMSRYIKQEPTSNK
jgi:hypothetical protein